MSPIPMEHGLLLAAALFALGMVGLVMRRNVLFMLMAAEIMMNATALAFVVGGARWAEPDGEPLRAVMCGLIDGAPGLIAHAASFE